MTQRSGFMDEFAKRDPEFCKLVSAIMDKTREPGALDPKTKVLISLALDIAGGHADGVRNIAARARAQGASEAEIIETARLAFLVSGIPGIIASLAAVPR